MEEWRYSSTILDLGTRWRWVVSFTPRAASPRRKSPRSLLDRRASLKAVQIRNILALPEIEPRPSSSQTVALPTPDLLVTPPILWFCNNYWFYESLYITWQAISIIHKMDLELSGRGLLYGINFGLLIDDTSTLIVKIPPTRLPVY
jgi:hypothetical protein